MPDYTLPSALRISDAVVFRELDGEAVLLNLDSGVYFGLDEVGTRFWQLVEQHGRLEPVLTALFQEYDVTEDVLHADLARLVAALVDKGLMERCDEALS
jgi:hypothetical protein